MGLIQDMQSIVDCNNKTIKRDNLDLPAVSKPIDTAKFQKVLTKLAVEKV